MTDIQMCQSKDCPMREQCYRFIAFPSVFNQSYCDFKWKEKDGEPECDNFLRVWKKN